MNATVCLISWFCATLILCHFYTDEIDVEGLVTGVGTNFLNRNSPALEDAFLVKKLRQLGAIIIGKSTMHEIGKKKIGLVWSIGLMNLEFLR